MPNYLNKLLFNYIQEIIYYKKAVLLEVSILGSRRLLDDEEDVDWFWAPDGVVAADNAEAETGPRTAIQHHDSRKLKAPVPTKECNTNSVFSTFFYRVRSAGKVLKLPW